MTKKILWLAPLVFSIPATAISCIQNQESEANIDESIVRKSYLSKLNLQQIASLNNIDNFIYYVDKSNQKIYLKNAIATSDGYLIFENSEKKYKPDFKFKSSWEQVISQYDNIKIQNLKEDNNIETLFTEYDFDVIKKVGHYSDGWFYYLSNLKNIDKDFYRINNPYFFDFQTIIFRFVEDMKNNSGLMNLRNSKSNTDYSILEKLFKNNYIQASTWLSEKYENYRDIFIKFLIVYLNKFNLNIKNIEIDWANSKQLLNQDGAYHFISFQIKSIELNNHKFVDKKYFENKNFYINNFRNYQTNLKFGVGLDGLDEKYPLYSDYVENPFLFFKDLKYLKITQGINHFIKGYDSIDYWNSRGLVYLINKFKNNLLHLNIPNNNQQSDLRYEIDRALFSNYYQTSQLIKLYINVIKKDNSKHKYVLLSSNFDDHGHFLKGIALKNKPADTLQSQDYYVFREGQKQELTSIDFFDFIDMDNNKPFKNLVKRALKNVYKLWEDRMNIDVKNLDIENEALLTISAYLNNYLLAYALEVKDKINTGVKKIELSNIVDNQDGTATLKFDFYKFIDDNDIEFYNENEKPSFYMEIKIKGFKNYQGNDIDEFELIKRGKYEN